VRRIVETQELKYHYDAPFAKHRTLGDVLLTPTRIYVKSCLAALRQFPNDIKALAHITGGGLMDNLERVLPKNLTLEKVPLPLPPLFSWLQETGHVPMADMQRIFNCGTGIALVVSKHAAAKVESLLKKQGEKVHHLGRIA